MYVHRQILERVYGFLPTTRIPLELLVELKIQRKMSGDQILGECTGTTSVCFSRDERRAFTRDRMVDRPTLFWCREPFRGVPLRHFV